MSDPKLSVIIATFDYRVEADYVASWTKRQHCADSDFEVIVVTHGRDPSIDASIRSVLRHGDQLIYGNDANENRMFRYNKGAAIAKSDLLLFTEDHVIADPNCVAELIAARANDRDPAFGESSVELVSRSGFPTDSTVNAWVVASDDRAENALSEAEAILCQRFLAAGHCGAPWKKVQVRGFMITREWFERLKGFPTSYGEFGATALGIEMNRCGGETQVVEAAMVTHVNHHRLNGLCEDALSYFDGEGTYRDEHSTEFIEHYLGRDENWRFRERNQRRIAKIEFITLCKLAASCVTKRWIKPQHAFLLIANLSDAGLRSVFGQRYPTALAWMYLKKCKWIWYCGSPFNRGRQLRFENLWNALARYGRNRAAVHPHRESSAPVLARAAAPDTGDSFQTADQFLESQIVGFHTVETFDGQPFRWTQAVASIRLQSPTRPCVVTIQTIPIRGPLTRMPLEVSISGRRLPQDRLRITDETIEVVIDETLGNVEAETVLCIGCIPMRSRRDPRQCGLAIHSVRIKESDQLVQHVHGVRRHSEPGRFKAA